MEPADEFTLSLDLNNPSVHTHVNYNIGDDCT